MVALYLGVTWVVVFVVAYLLQPSNRKRSWRAIKVASGFTSFLFLAIAFAGFL